MTLSTFLRSVLQVHDVEEALDDLIENGYANNPDAWKDQIETMKDQLTNLAVRAENRDTELKLAVEKLEDFHNTLSSVMQSLSQGDDEDAAPLNATSGTEQIHQQVSRCCTLCKAKLLEKSAAIVSSPKSFLV